MLIETDSCKGLDMKLCQLAEENNLTDEQFRYFTKGWQALWGMIIELPSADRPQGEWIESFKQVEVKRGAYLGTKFVHDGWSCSECSEVVEKRYPNCPYCLARMEGADDGK